MIRALPYSWNDLDLDTTQTLDAKAVIYLILSTGPTLCLQNRTCLFLCHGSALDITYRMILVS